MSRTSLEKVIEEVKALTLEEQRKVKNLIDSLLGSPGEAKKTLSLEDLLEQRLLEDGVISKLPTRDLDPETYKEFEPIEVSGKPVSETIIEERG
jgi:hypothetical protein